MTSSSDHNKLTGSPPIIYARHSEHTFDLFKVLIYCFNLVHLGYYMYGFQLEVPTSYFSTYYGVRFIVSTKDPLTMQRLGNVAITVYSDYNVLQRL